MIGIPLSVVFGGPLSGWLLGFDGHLNLHGWQWLYLAEGLPATLLGFVVLGWLTEKPAEARWLTAEQRTGSAKQWPPSMSRHDPASHRTGRIAAASHGLAAGGDHVLLPDR